MHVRHRVRQVELTCDNKTGSAVTAEILATDESSGSSTTYDFTDTTYEKNWGSLSWDSADTTADNNWAYNRRRQAKAAFRRDGDWFQIKVTHSTANQPFRLAHIDAGYFILGDR
jgi:hypothetical protein